MNILLIEDNPGDAKLIEINLKEAEPQVQLSWVDRLNKGIEKMQAEKFDAVLLDLNLPDSFGLDTIDRVVNADDAVPVIVLTGNADRDAAVTAVSRGAQDYIEKGVYTPDSLFRAVRYAVQRMGLRRKILEQELSLSSASKMAALGELTGFIFHEIGNPLAIASLYVEKFKKETAGKDALDCTHVATFADDLARNLNRMTKILSNLRSYVRGAGQKEPLQEVKASDLFGGAVELCINRFKSKGVKLTLSENADKIKIHCRPIQISQVLINLLNNSFDAVENLPQKWVKLEAGETKDTVEIIVTDSGSGIPAEIVDKILQTFFTTKDAGKGTGLGLSISKRIAEEHGGSLKIDQTSPNTRFVLSLPKTPKI